MKQVVLWGLILAAVAAAGCGGQTARQAALTPPKPVDKVDYIDLWAVPPSAINWDDVPGPDGVRVRAFLYLADRAEPVLIRGTLEFLMFADRIHQADVLTTEPTQVWSFSDQELATRQVRAAHGWGYAAQLGWGKNVPKSPVVTLVARFKPYEGRPLYSMPMLVAVPK
jgi:hypothetical protein